MVISMSLTLYSDIQHGDFNVLTCGETLARPHYFTKRVVGSYTCLNPHPSLLKSLYHSRRVSGHTYVCNGYQFSVRCFHDFQLDVAIVMQDFYYTCNAGLINLSDYEV